MSRIMTSDEQAIADLIGLNVSVYIDDDQGFQFQPGIAVEFILRQGVRIPLGSNLADNKDKVVKHLQTWLAERLNGAAEEAKQRAYGK